MNSHEPPASPTARWARSSCAWVTHAEAIAIMTRDASDALVEALDAPADGRVLDVACGPGDPSLRLARSRSSVGSVVAIDASVVMLRHAAERAAEDDLRLRGIHARGEHLPFRDSSFDALCSRFGVMFFEDVPASLADARRVLRPGGRAVYAVWAPREDNAYFTVADEVLDEHGCPAAEVPPDAPTPFRFGTSGELAALMRSAGFADVSERSVSIAMRLPGFGPGDLLDFQRTISPSIGDRSAELTDDALGEVRSAMARRLAPWTTDDGLSLPGRILIVAGSRPAT